MRQVAEGTPLDTEIGAPVAATDAEGDVLTYALSGPDAGSFLIVPETGALMVWTDLDYETQATYSVTVEVHDGRDSKGQPSTSKDNWVTVSILLTNEDEVGMLTLSSEQPYPGTPLAATLTDPDGRIAGSSWVWHRSENGTGAWAIIEGAIAASYRPTATDVGNYLRATASYTDGQGSSKVASGVSANPVEDRVPPPPPPPPPPPTATANATYANANANANANAYGDFQSRWRRRFRARAGRPRLRRRFSHDACCRGERAAGRCRR